VQGVTVEGRYDLLRSDGMAKLLEGPLLMVSFMAPGLAEAVEQEARRRGIPVEVVEPET
jgi:hypothetical protein